jgi:DnaJ family protein B protein 13
MAFFCRAVRALLRIALLGIAACRVVTFLLAQALLDQQENRAVFRLCNDGRAGERAGGGVLGAGVGPRMERTRSDDFCTRSAPGTPAREFKKVYSSGNSGGRRAFAEFSSSIMRKAPPLERKLECTLEELCRGCKKEVKFTRDVVTKNGYLLLSSAFSSPF